MSKEKSDEANDPALEQEPVEIMLEREERLKHREKVGLPPVAIRRVIREKGGTEVVCVDAPGPGGACHEYMISQSEGFNSFFLVMFQKGPITCDEDVNGCQIEDLIAICMDRLKGFQSGAFACPENKSAYRHLLFAMSELEKRTADRESRGVEGKNIQ